VKARFNVSHVGTRKICRDPKNPLIAASFDRTDTFDSFVRMVCYACARARGELFFSDTTVG
jgi:hypothetical protein